MKLPSDNILQISIAYLCFTLLLAHAPKVNAEDIEASAEIIKREKQAVAEAEIESRSVMGRLYQISQRMKNMSRKRDILMNKMLAVESEVKKVARNVAELENKIKKQRGQLSKRLKAIYILGGEGVVRVLFSSASAQDLDQTIKYLRLISEHDYEMLKQFDASLQELNKQKALLNNQVKQLLAVQAQYNKQEQVLGKDQEAKAKILSLLVGRKQQSIMNLERIRASLGASDSNADLSLSFYEKRKQLISPIKAPVVRRYGLIENAEFQYVLSHKGWSFFSVHPQKVLSIFDGVVAFVGQIPGYGKSIILDHGDHYYSVYTKVESVHIKEGQKIKERELIAKSKEDFYFEIRHFSDPVDPAKWIMDI